MSPSHRGRRRAMRDSSMGRSGTSLVLVVLLGTGAAIGAAACSGSGSGEARPKVTGDDGGVAAAAAPVEIELRPLGTTSLDGFGWRRGAGKDAFARALAAEKKGDLPAVEREAAAALAADPGHLEAAWLVAVARARQGNLDGVLAPLEVAAAGDWGKWGERSLELGVFAAWRATPVGEGWVRAGERYRAALSAALTGALVVVARTAPPRMSRAEGEERIEHRAELYGVDLAGGRWVRLTRTGGAVVGALPAQGRPLVAYAAYRAVAKKGAGGAAIRELRVGVVDLSTGRGGREVVLRDVHEVTLGWASRGAEPALVARVVPAKLGGAAAPARTYALDWRQGLKRGTDLPPPRDGLRVRPLAAERRRVPIAGVTADWDDAGTASALRVDKSKKVVTPAGGAMIDGHSVTWSPDGSRLAFATAAADPCGEGDARGVTVHVVDAASGRHRTVHKGSGVPSPVWLDATRLALVDGNAVRVVDATSRQELARIAGGGGVVTSALGESRACADEPSIWADDPLDGDEEPEDLLDPDAGTGPADLPDEP